MVRIIDVREKTLSVSSAMRNASIGFGTMTASALVIVTDVKRDGKTVVGLGFDSLGRYGHGGLLRERFIPRLLEANPQDYLDATEKNIDPLKVWKILMRDEKPGGHGERCGAVGLIDAAVWDLVAKLNDSPLWAVLNQRYGTQVVDPRVPVYATGGHYREHDDVSGLQDEVRRFVDLGYKRVKIKFGGLSFAEDRRRVEAALAVLGTGTALAVDCNGTHSVAAAIAMMDGLAEYGLAWVEEPVEPLDFEAHKAVAQHCALPIATGENLFSADDTRNLLRYGGLRPERDFLQVDVSLSYGIIEYLKILDCMEAHGWRRSQCIPHAGHLLSLHVVAGLGLACHETAPLGALAHGRIVEDGMLRPGDAPGVGIEQCSALFTRFDELLN